jgi:hypothetical protein
MGETIALALKYGVVALPTILGDYGIVMALFAFFTFMPLGHLTIGVLLVILGIFWPRIPAQGEQHMIKIGVGNLHLDLQGPAQTILLGIGAFVIAGSFAETMLRS